MKPIDSVEIVENFWAAVWHACGPEAHSFTGIAVWEVRGDGKLCHNWVEHSFFELYQQLHPAVARGQETR